MEMCIDCKFFNENVGTDSIKKTLEIVNTQLKQFRQMVEERDRELEMIGMELAIGLSESFEALKKIASGDPLVKIPETSKVELIRKLKELINLTAVEFGTLVDLSHEFAIGIAEQFDVLHRVSRGDLAARISGISRVELLESLKNISNEMIEGVEREITERKKTEQLIRESERKFRDLFENTTDLLQLITPDGRFLLVNPSWMVTLGYFDDDIEHLSLWDIIHPENMQHCKEIFQQALNGKSAQNIETVLVAKDGKPVVLEGNISGFYKGTTLEYMRCIFHDITERKQMEEDLRSLSLRDGLTALYNRRGILTLAEQQLKIAERMKKEMLMIYIDLDKMKHINDTFGHQEGDRALIDTAHILRDTFRSSDIIARLGGDEFAILALETGEMYSETLVNRLKANVDTHNDKSGRSYTLSLSVGVTHYDPEAPCSIEELLSRADALMYEQKKRRKA